MRTLRGASAALLFCGLIATARTASAAVKTDIVELKNGDRITCEIKKLDRGKLTVKTDGVGTISIEWDDIQFVTSAARYELELQSGERVIGTLVRAVARTVDVVDAAYKQRVSLNDIVRLAPLGGTLWKRLDGSISAGFNFTEANQQTQLTLDTTVSYRSRRWFSELEGDSLLTSQTDADRQTRNDLSLKTARFLKPRWQGLGFLNLQQNEELSLNLRSLVGTGVGRTLTQSNTKLSSLIGGIAYTREVYAGEGDRSLAEAVAGASWEWFTFDGKSTSLSARGFTYYALASEKRFRLEANTAFKSDIVGDLYWKLNAFESYISHPPEDGKKSDFGISATIGWSF